MKEDRKSPLRIFWIVPGGVCLGPGTAGAALPILPTVPFYPATLFTFAKGSRRRHDWFVGTGLYRKNLESYVQHRVMTRKTKLAITGTITAAMAVGFACMGSVPAGRVILTPVWI